MADDLKWGQTWQMQLHKWFDLRGKKFVKLLELLLLLLLLLICELFVKSAEKLRFYG